MSTAGLDDGRRALIEAMRGLALRGHSPGSSGNVSVRQDEGVLITPTGIAPADLEPGDLVVIALDGSVMSGEHAPSSEWPMHTALYRVRPDVGAVVHCHSRFATILACARRGIPPIHYMVAATGGFDVPCAPYATFGTPELSERILEVIGQRNACLLANHGQVAVGRDLPRAIRAAEEVERLAETHWGALAIGGPVELSEEQMKDVVTRFLAGYGQDH